MFGSSISTCVQQSRRRRRSLLLLAMTLCLAGCGANYKLSDGDYRPLGDPTAAERRP
ncbi:type VI secretion protein [Pseudomonas sp. G11-1]|nr:type VI secretion protein [Pseudomonas sp. G11-1]MCO5789494.1 type VI secretion protein [Pseudomonas sp. G11-2]TKA92610.1 type VI secretion protein [Halopseudomonas bauzanensis]